MRVVMSGCAHDPRRSHLSELHDRDGGRVARVQHPLGADVMHVLAAWQNIGIGAGLIFAALVLMQKAFDRCATPLDTGPINVTRHYDREPRDKTVPKSPTTR